MSNADVITRWIDVMEGRKSRLQRSNHVWAEGNIIYSYGRHFPIAEHYGTQAGGWYLINGDRFSNTTSRHQSNLRGALSLATRRTVILPFSAIDAAGIIHESIEPIDVSDDTWIEHKRESTDWHTLPRHRRHTYVPDPCPGHVCHPYGPNDGSIPEDKCIAQGRGESACQIGWHMWDYSQHPPTRSGPWHCPGHSHAARVQPDADGVYRWTDQEHRLGASVFRARYVSRRRSLKLCRGPFRGDARVTTLSAVVAIEDAQDRWTRDGPDAWQARDDGRKYRRAYHRERVAMWSRYCRHNQTEPHRYDVDDSGTAIFLSGFDQNERPPLYFLAQLPKGVDRIPAPESDQYADLSEGTG
jgi:hypothetical protein